MPLSMQDALQYAQANTARERFGPHADHPCISLDLGSSPLDGAPQLAHLNSWLRGLPCPVIGIGNTASHTQAISETCDVILSDAAKLARIESNIEHAPMAAMVLVQHLRASERQSPRDALTAESFAYASLQAGPEFLRWLAGYDRTTTPSAHPPLSLDIDKGTLTVTLTQPDTRNAIGIEMRDALCEALDLAGIDPDIKTVRIRAEGQAFSIGGDINEFGQVSDPATAHWVRSLRLPAQRLVQLSETTEIHVHVNGAAIGAGAEIAAFGHHVTASPKAWFQLPELKYGLIPGAGGTVSLPRRIGRQRTAYMALSMARINAQTALDWGLIDAIVE